MRSAIIAAAAVAALAGCSSYDSVTQRIAQSITPYRITVVQGNFVSQEKAAQLQAGMTREQVRALLGTPLLADMFHADRWDYLFYFKRGSTSVVQQRDLVLTFASDRLASWTGADNLPSELDLLAISTATAAARRRRPPPRRSGRPRRLPPRAPRRLPRPRARPPGWRSTRTRTPRRRARRTARPTRYRGRARPAAASRRPRRLRAARRCRAASRRAPRRRSSRSSSSTARRSRTRRTKRRRRSARKAPTTCRTSRSPRRPSKRPACGNRAACAARL